jgi:ABC-type dipeptide/oligopeptide/nickel transport system permease component
MIVLGISRGIVVLMDRGQITDTILNFAEGAVSGLSSVVFIMIMYLLVCMGAYDQHVEPRKNTDCNNLPETGPAISLCSGRQQ